MPDAGKPTPNALPRHPRRFAGLGLRSTATYGRDRLEDVCRRIDLARQDIARKHALTRPALVAPRQNDRHPPVDAANLNPPLDPAPRQLQIGARTPGTPAACKDPLIAAGDMRRVGGRLYR